MRTCSNPQEEWFWRKLKVSWVCVAQAHNQTVARGKYWRILICVVGSLLSVSARCSLSCTHVLVTLATGAWHVHRLHSQVRWFPKPCWSPRSPPLRGHKTSPLVRPARYTGTYPPLPRPGPNFVAGTFLRDERMVMSDLCGT